MIVTSAPPHNPWNALSSTTTGVVSVTAIRAARVPDVRSLRRPFCDLRDLTAAATPSAVAFDQLSHCHASMLARYRLLERRRAIGIPLRCLRGGRLGADNTLGFEHVERIDGRHLGVTDQGGTLGIDKIQVARPDGGSHRALVRHRFGRCQAKPVVATADEHRSDPPCFAKLVATCSIRREDAAAEYGRSGWPGVVGFWISDPSLKPPFAKRGGMTAE